MMRWDSKRWVGVGSVVVVLAAMTLLNYGDYFNQSLAPAFVALTFAAFVGGLWPGLTSASLVSLYAGWILIPDQTPRAMVIIVSSLAIALMVGLLKRRARVADSINGNIRTLIDIMHAMQDLLEDWQTYNREELKKRLKKQVNNLVDLTTRVKGWHDLRTEIEETRRLAELEKSAE